MRCETTLEVCVELRDREEFHTVTVAADVVWPEGQDPSFSSHSVFCQTCYGAGRDGCSWWTLTPHERQTAEDLLCSVYPEDVKDARQRLLEELSEAVEKLERVPPEKLGALYDAAAVFNAEPKRAAVVPLRVVGVES